MYSFVTLYSQNMIATCREKKVQKRKTFGQSLSSRTSQNSPQQRQLNHALGNCTAYTMAVAHEEESPRTTCMPQSCCCCLTKGVIALLQGLLTLMSSSKPLCLDYRCMQPYPFVLVLKDAIDLSVLFHYRMHIIPYG